MFLRQFDHYVDMNNLDDHVAASTLIVSLRADAAQEALTLPRDATLDAVKEALRERFESMTTPMSASLKFKNALR